MRTNKKRKKRLKLYAILLIIIVLLILGLIIYKIMSNNNKIKLKIKEQETIETIKNHYQETVITNKETDLYDSEENKIGKINESVIISLEDINIDINTKYFKIKDFEDTYIKYEDVDKSEEKITYDERYLRYIPFNQNIKTKDKVSFYDKSDNYLYTINKSYEFTIIIKDNNRYGVEFNDRLLYIKNEDVENIYDNHNTDLSNSNGVAVLNYHFFYDENDPEDAKGCNEAICHSKAQFKTHLDYFKENNIFTVTMDELEMYMDRKLQLPKSVLITIDDGGRTKVGVDMLTEYKMNATIFLVSSWYDPSTYYKTDYIELHSHSHNMHNGGKCPGGQGAEIKCLPKETILDDLTTSRNVLNNTRAFCYPFYEYNDYSMNLLKEAGFTMAFIGEIPTYYGYKLAEVGGDKFKIPRFVIMTHTTMKDIDEYFNEIKN